MEPLTWLVLQVLLGRYEGVEVLYLYYVEGWATYRVARRLGLSRRAIRYLVSRVWEEVGSCFELVEYLRRYYSILLEVEPLVLYSEDGFTCRLCGETVLRNPARHILERHRDVVYAVRDLVRSGRGLARF